MKQTYFVEIVGESLIQTEPKIIRVKINTETEEERKEIKKLINEEGYKIESVEPEPINK